jgi:predicted glycogen debranching enzyme
LKDTIDPTRAGSPDGQVSEATRPMAGSEWLESDGLGGFASGPVLGPRTRRYHALLLTATTPPTGRIVLVNGFEAHVDTGTAAVPISAQHYLPDVLYPDGSKHLIGFSAQPWPTWTFDLGNDLVLNQEIFVARDTCETVVIWTVENCPPGYRLSLRLLMSGRDYHSLHRENEGFDFHASVRGGNVAWKPYPSLPATTALTNGVYRNEPEWFRNFLYDDERERGLDHVEDLASPGVFTWDLSAGSAVMVLRAGDALNVRTEAYVARITADELQRRESANSPWDIAADTYIVDRGNDRTLLAGFPWFTDWGRDTFIAMRGLVIARARLSEAERILNAWAATVSEGMLPNRFVDAGDLPEFNSVDASLWFVIAAKEFIDTASSAGFTVKPATEKRLVAAIEAILQGYAAGTRYGIAADTDGLLRCGEPGVQLTWMDAKVGDFVVTPRTGKPVEVQALWINALRIGGERSPEWKDLAGKAEASFAQRFFNPDNGCLYDVVDVDHLPGTVDPKIRPNQILAAGGLPFSIVKGQSARKIVDLVERRLLTPMGLRTLDPEDQEYRPRYGGDAGQRDGAYHQGTVWPWLMGPFVDAWLKTRPNSSAALAEARARFLAPLLSHLRTAGIGHVSEIADGDPPHAPRGCPFQAWSLGELIRIDALLKNAEKVPIRG